MGMYLFTRGSVFAMESTESGPLGVLVHRLTPMQFMFYYLV